MLNFDDRHFTPTPVKEHLFSVFQNSPWFIWANGVISFSPDILLLPKLLKTKLKDQACDVANCCCCEAENSKVFPPNLFTGLVWCILDVSHAQSPHVLRGILCPTWHEAQERAVSPAIFSPRLYFPGVHDSPLCACGTVLILTLSFNVSESCTMEAGRI